MSDASAAPADEASKKKQDPIDENNQSQEAGTTSADSPERFTNNFEIQTGQSLFQSIAADLEHGLPRLASSTSDSALAQFRIPNLELTDLQKAQPGEKPGTGEEETTEGDTGPGRDPNRRDSWIPRPGEESRTFSYRGQTMAVVTRDGCPVAYFDQNGRTWTSEDGRTWQNQDNPNEIWHGSVSFDANGNLVRQDSSYGLTTTYGTDGSVTFSFTTREGQTVSHTQFEDGRQRVVDGRGRTWDSPDGRTWTSGSETRQGSFRIDEYARLFYRDRSGRIDRAAESAQTRDIGDRIRDMERRYNIRIERPGYPREYQGEGTDTNTPVTSRMPTMAELQVIEESLQKYRHLAPTVNGRPDFAGLRFVFLRGDGNGERVSEHGWYVNNTITFGPGDQISARGIQGLEGTALHEIGHHLQHLRWRGRNGEEYTPRHIREFFGFVHGLDERGQPVWRLRDRDGTLWQQEPIERDGRPEMRWVALGPDGRPDRTRTRDDEEMRNSMPPDRQPSSHYFDNPHEAHAEALAMYLLNPRMLWEANPALYRAMRDWDQADIDRRYGAPGGVPRMIRVDGHIVPNTPENRVRRDQAEAGWGPDSASPRTVPRHDRQRCQCHGG